MLCGVVFYGLCRGLVFGRLVVGSGMCSISGVLSFQWFAL